MSDSNHEDKTNTLEEYETQYFGFGRRFLKNSLKSLIESKFQKQIQNAESYFTTSLDLNEELKENLNKKCLKLLEFCLSKSKVSLEKLDSEIDKYFSIPVNVLLQTDNEFQNSASEAEIDLLRDELNQLRSSVLSSDAAEIVMERERAQAEYFKKHIFSEEEQLAKILKSMTPTFNVLVDGNDND